MPDIVTQYRRIRAGAGFAEKTHRGRLRFDGPDAVAFLQALLTADLAGLEAGQSRYSAYLTPNGRMLADLTVVHRGDHLIADVPAPRAQPLAERFDSLIFSEDVSVSNVSDAILQIAVLGERASDVVEKAVALVAAGMPEDGRSIFTIATDDAPVESRDLFAPSSCRESLLGALAAAGGTPMPAGMADIFRIEAARPEFGVDMNEETIPLEAGLLDRAISTTKGCYVGQEIIIRVLHRGGGRVARRLVKLEFDPAATTAPQAGTKIVADDREVGAITSAVFSPDAARVIALGYVARDFAETGRTLTIADPACVGARIVALAGGVRS